MEDITKRIGFIVGFLILTMIVDSSFGRDITSKFLFIVLASMLILNSQKIIYWLQTNFD